MATRATMRSSRSETLRRWAGTSITAFFVASDPVPEVVGSATKGSGAAVSGKPFPITSR